MNHGGRILQSEAWAPERERREGRKATRSEEKEGGAGLGSNEQGKG